MTVREEVFTQVGAPVTAAFGLAALAWNGAIQALFRQVFGTTDTITDQLIYAILVTIGAVDRGGKGRGGAAGFGVGLGKKSEPGGPGRTVRAWAHRTQTVAVSIPDVSRRIG